MDKIFKLLNTEQKSAVTSPLKYLLINAGPGTGKTTTIAAKILYLIGEKGISSDRILGISFSRAAKGHLVNKLDELSDLLGYGGKPRILTFHSLAYRTIRYGIHFEETRYREGFKLVNTEDFQKLDPSILKGLCNEYSNREIVNIALATAYNRVRQGNDIEQNPLNHWSKISQNKTYHINTINDGRILISGKDLQIYWERVHKIEKIKNVTDYQGMITEAIRLLKLKSNTYKELSSNFEYIFVDEFQDTSLAQEQFLLSLLHEEHYVTVVGDKNQTIYTFNGSNSKNLDRFLTFFTQRDHQNTGFITLRKNYRSTGEIVKLSNDLISENVIDSVKGASGTIPTIVETQSIFLAGGYIAKTIKKLLEDQYSPSDICILYRKNSEYSPQKDHVIEQLNQLNIKYSLIERAKENITHSINTQVLKIREMYEDELLDDVLSILEKKGESKELINFVKDVINQGATYTDDLIDYLMEIDEPLYDYDDDSVTIKTIHDSKGLEYPVVFILFLGDRDFPHSSQPDIDEEKRLLYVAITRASERLYILGKKGFEFESFLDLCLHSDVRHEKYHSIVKEETTNGFNSKDKEIIDRTTEDIEEREKREKEELRRLMELF